MIIYFLGMAVTFPFAYVAVRRATKFMVEDPEDAFMREFLSLMTAFVGSMIWPLSWAAYLIKKIVEKPRLVETKKDRLPEGYTLQIWDKGRTFEKVVVVNETGKDVGRAYTSVYGLEGAAKEAIEKAKKTIAIENRPAHEYDELNRKYGLKERNG